MKQSFVRHLGVGCLVAALSPAALAAPVDFNQQIKPILELNCVKCHGAEQAKGELRLHTRAAALKGGASGKASLVAGQPEQSPLYTTTLLPATQDEVMPPKKEARLTQAQTQLLRDWIAQGANWPEGVTLAAIQRVDFVKEIQPILEFNCVTCHKEGHAKGELRLDTRELAFKGGENGTGIVPGQPKSSKVYVATTVAAEDDALMPPKNKGGPLPKESIELLSTWISQGAIWPDGLTLVGRKAEVAANQNDPAVVAEIHKNILSNLTAANEADMKPYTDKIPGLDVSFDLVPIPGGKFLMGSPDSEKGRKADEGPQHEVAIEPFWMGKCEVTWNEYTLFMYPEEERDQRTRSGLAAEPFADAVARPSKPYVEMSFGMGKDGFPAISMTQHAASTYCKWLSAKTGHYYRLPTEAEWEYAARAGTKTVYFFGDDPARLGEYAWYGKNSDWKYQKVGRKKPNPWGLHDILGNVNEWVLDQYDAGYYEKFKGTLTTEPWNKATKPYPHVVRGGSWDDEEPAALRSAVRRASDKTWKIQDPQLPKSIWYHTDAQFLGFRVVRPLKVPPVTEIDKWWKSGVEKD